MKREDYPQFKTVLGMVFDLYPKAPRLTPATMTTWFRALEGYELAVISTALTRHVRNPDVGQFVPLPADVVKLIEGGTDDLALQAWAKVDRAVRSVGCYRTVVFDDPAIHYAITALGGWIKLGRLTEEDWKFQRQPFATLYRGVRGRPFDFPPMLLGIAECENGPKHREAPILIGDEARCLAVLAGGTDRPAIAIRPLSELLPQLPTHTTEETPA